MIPHDPAERDALAAEYVLGTIDADAAAEVVRAMDAGDAALREAVAAWERRLAPLMDLAPEGEPPPGLWNRIAGALPQQRTPTQQRPSPQGRPPRPRRWPAVALAGVGWLAAACLAAFTLLRPPPGPALVTMMVPGKDAPAWFVEADSNGAIRLVSVNGRPPPEPGRVSELWALPPGADAPTSLGVIPSEGLVNLPAGTIRPRENTLIEITSEPPGGSPTGRPTGPLRFVGKLHPPVSRLDGPLNLARSSPGWLFAARPAAGPE
jgi:anti-sigma-K factor RskA